MPGWLSDVRYALRGWRRQPGFAAIAVLSLAAGIGLNTAVFSIVNAIFLQSIRGVPEPDRVAAIGTRVAFATFRDLRDSVRTLDGVAAWQPVSVRLRYRDVVQRRVVPAVSDEYFAVLGVSPWRGRFFDVQHQRMPVANAEVVVDFEFWRDALGSDPQAIGQTILINDTPATIRGIAQHAFHGFGPERPPVWMPLGMLPAVRGTAPRWDDSAESGWRVFGRIADGGSLEQVNAELAALAAREPHRFPAEPLHMAIGAPRRAVLRMLLWEGAFVVLLGCAAGMALTGVAFQFMSGMVFARWTLEPFAVAGVLATFAVTTFAACYVPGRRATRIDPIRALRAE